MTGGIVAVGFIIDPGLWRAWFDTVLNAEPTYELGHPLGPLPLRLALGAAVTAYGAWKGQAWLVPIAMLIAVPGPVGLQPRASRRRPAPDPPIDELSATEEASSRFRVRSIAESIGVSWLTMAALILVRANEVAIPLDFILRPLVVAIIPSILIGLLASSLGRLRVPAAAGLSILALTPALWPAIVALGTVELAIWWLQRRTGVVRALRSRTLHPRRDPPRRDRQPVRLAPLATDYLSTASGSAGSGGPPIYLVLVDGYPRLDALAQLGIDNTDLSRSWRRAGLTTIRRQRRATNGRI